MDAEIFTRKDVRIALGIYAEYVKKHSPINPAVEFFEVDRDTAAVDSLWHTPSGDRVKFTGRSPLKLPCLNQFEKPDWRLTAMGIVPQRQDRFIIAYKHLEAADYFPQRGDVIYFTGYRRTITNVYLPPEAYWQQTSQWLGLYVTTVIAPQGDVLQTHNPATVAPVEKSHTSTWP